MVLANFFGPYINSRLRIWAEQKKGDRGARVEGWGFKAMRVQDCSIVNPIKLETGLRPNSAGIPYKLRLWGFQLLGFCYIRAKLLNKQQYLLQSLTYMKVYPTTARIIKAPTLGHNGLENLVLGGSWDIVSEIITTSSQGCYQWTKKSKPTSTDSQGLQHL